MDHITESKACESSAVLPILPPPVAAETYLQDGFHKVCAKAATREWVKTSSSGTYSTSFRFPRAIPSCTLVRAASDLFPASRARSRACGREGLRSKVVLHTKRSRNKGVGTRERGLRAEQRSGGERRKQEREKDEGRD